MDGHLAPAANRIPPIGRLTVTVRLTRAMSSAVGLRHTPNPYEPGRSVSLGGALQPRVCESAILLGMAGHQEFRALTPEDVGVVATHIAEMQKWAREIYLGTQHVEEVRSLWDRYFEAERELHWLIPPAAEPGSE